MRNTISVKKIGIEIVQLKVVLHESLNVTLYLIIVCLFVLQSGKKYVDFLLK